MGYALVALALLPPWRGRSRYLGIGLAVTGVSLVLAAGPSPTAWGWSYWTPWGWVTDWLPGLATIRVPSRFVVVAYLGLCLLVAVGAHRWLHRWSPAAQWGTVLALAALFLLWARPGALPVTELPPGATVPPAYTWLGRNGEGRPLLELPRPSWPEAAHRMRMSTHHWLSIVDGYGGYPVEREPGSRRPPDRRTRTRFRRGEGRRRFQRWSHGLRSGLLPGAVRATASG